MDVGSRRHWVQCVTRSCEERGIYPKNPELFLTLAKSSKAPFVRDDIKLLTIQEWALIEKEVRSENGRRMNQCAVRSVANQMKEETGEMPTLDAAASELGIRAIQGAVRSVANQMKEETGIMPTLKAAASELGIRAIQGTVRSAANQMKEETGIMPTLEAAASELGRRLHKNRMDKIVMTGTATKDAPSFAGRRANDNRRISTIFCATENCENTVQYKYGLCKRCHELLPKKKLITEFCIGVGGGGCEKVKFYRGNQCQTCYMHPDEKKMREAKKAADPKCTIHGCRRSEFRPSYGLCSKHYREQS